VLQRRTEFFQAERTTLVRIGLVEDGFEPPGTFRMRTAFAFTRRTRRTAFAVGGRTRTISAFVRWAAFAVARRTISAFVRWTTFAVTWWTTFAVTWRRTFAVAWRATFTVTWWTTFAVGGRTRTAFPLETSVVQGDHAAHEFRT
jgi:hypothetical protein